MLARGRPYAHCYLSGLVAVSFDLEIPCVTAAYTSLMGLYFIHFFDPNLILNVNQ